jgi:hypothetical protein
MRIVYPVLFAIVLLGLMAPAASAADAPEILFSANPKNVQIVKSGKTLRLVMPANARTTWFTDRPERKAGSTNLRRLAATWTAMGFRADPPNAALLLTHRGATRTHVITLTNPRIRKGRVSFRIRAVPNQDEAGHRHTDPLRRGRYARAELFIDDTTIPPCLTQLSGSATCIAAADAYTGVQYTELSSPVAFEACAEVSSPGQYKIQWVAQVGWGWGGLLDVPPCGTAGPQVIVKAMPFTTMSLQNMSRVPMIYRFSVS